MITMYPTSWCGDCKRSKAFLDEKGVDYDEVDIEKDARAAKFVEKVNHGNRSVPTIVFDDGSTLVEPTNEELEKKLGLS